MHNQLKIPPPFILRRWDPRALCRAAPCRRYADTLDISSSPVSSFTDPSCFHWGMHLNFPQRLLPYRSHCMKKKESPRAIASVITWVL